MMKKWKIRMKRMMLEFLTKLKRRKKKEIFDWKKTKELKPNEMLKGNKKEQRKQKKRGEIKRIAPQWIKQLLC